MAVFTLEESRHIADDGLSGVGHKLGAKAVLASLWEVDNGSTSELMADFYKRWTGGGGSVTKVEALRQAQLDLLHGKTGSEESNADRGLRLCSPCDRYQRATRVPTTGRHLCSSETGGRESTAVSGSRFPH